MNIELDEAELSIILDGLASLPLMRVYNLFNRLVSLMPRQQAANSDELPPASPDAA